jgi:AcrR family transcriptional regulator
MVIHTQADTDSTRERILEAAEEVFRRFGPDKTRVVDVARHLGMSHGNIYRHFGSKAEMQDAVAERWLNEITTPLDQVVNGRGKASDRIRLWVESLIAAKRKRLDQDPEMFATYSALAQTSRHVIKDHVDHLRAQLCLIIADGVRDGEFKVKDPTKAAKAVHEATMRYHHPFFVSRSEQNSEGLQVVLNLVIAGLKVGVI